MKIGFVGAGNMGGAIIRGILNRQLFSPQDILISSLPSPQLDKLLADTGVILCPDNSNLIEKSDIVSWLSNRRLCPQFCRQQLRQFSAAGRC